MCSATTGANPVNRCTVAASAIFSRMSRGVPGVPNTLNRVPEFPKAQDSNSMARLSTAGPNPLVVMVGVSAASWMDISVAALVGHGRVGDRDVGAAVAVSVGRVFRFLRQVGRDRGAVALGLDLLECLALSVGCP